jgi:hypothetical protein
MVRRAPSCLPIDWRERVPVGAKNIAGNCTVSCTIGTALDRCGTYDCMLYRLRLPSNVARLSVAKSALTWTTSLSLIVFELVPRYVA